MISRENWKAFGKRESWKSKLDTWLVDFFSKKIFDCLEIKDKRVRRNRTKRQLDKAYGPKKFNRPY